MICDCSHDRVKCHRCHRYLDDQIVQDASNLRDLKEYLADADSRNMRPSIKLVNDIINREQE